MHLLSPDDTNKDGVLDENDEVITLSNIYSISDKKTKNVTNTVEDVLNADGENEGTVMIFPATLSRILPMTERQTL